LFIALDFGKYHQVALQSKMIQRGL
jgi:hypothetical protein